MDKLKAMQVFMQIADQGSLTAAARVLDSSLPAVVRTLAALEEDLQVRLFNRTTRRIALTEEGKHYLESCRQILTTVEDAEAALTLDASEPSGQLTITAPVLFGQMYVAPAITGFVQRYEQMRCNVLLLDRVVNLLEEGIDIGIRIGTLEDSSLVAQPVGSVHRMVVASPDFIDRHGEPVHPKDLLKFNCVRFSAATGPWWTFHENGKQFTVPVTGNLDFNQATPAIEACAAGLGFGMFISYQVAPYLKQNKLKAVLEKFEAPSRTINIIYPHARLLPARTKLLIAWLKEALKNLNP